MARLTLAQHQMLHDLTLDDEPDGDCWAHFDPPFAQETVQALVRRGMIEVKNGDEYRLSHAGRAYLSAPVED